MTRQCWCVSPRALWVIVLLALVAGAGLSHAQQSREWTRITDPTDPNIHEAALGRTDDGVLHVVWLKKNGTKLDLMHTAIGKDGRVLGTPTAVLEGWTNLNNPDLVVSKDGGLHLFFGGQRTTDVKDPYSGGSLYGATAPASGAAWTLVKGAFAQSSSVLASPVGAALMPDGTPVMSWAASFALSVHMGINPKSPDQKYQANCCAYQPDVAVDATSGEGVLGWYSNAAKQEGLYTQEITPTAGEKQFVPDSATPDRSSSLSVGQRMAITGRIGAPGIYVAYGAGYPTYKTINLWRHGSTEPFVVAPAQGARLVNIAAGPEGRLWVMWERGRRVFATRSNRDATRFGAIVEVAPPMGKAESGIYKVKGEGSLGPLDLFAACQSPSELATYHTQVFPGLSLAANPTAVTAVYGGSITFQVTDAGDPVPDATISFAGKSLTTDAQGRASYAVAKGPKPGGLLATASKAGYTSASLRLAVK